MVISGETIYFNVICEEMSCVGGKVIHVDTNVGSLEEARGLFYDNLGKHPNGKWELYPMILKN